MNPNGRPPALEPRFLSGHFLGYVDGTNTNLVVNADGVFRCRSILRMPVPDRWSNNVLSFQNSVLQPDPLRPGEIRVPVRAHVQIDPSSPTDPTSTDGTDEPSLRGPQRARLMKSDFQTHSFTVGCRGCDTRRPGRNLPPSKLANHSEKCRRSMEEKIRASQSGQSRLDKAHYRITRHIVDQSGDIVNQEPRTPIPNDVPTRPGKGDGARPSPYDRPVVRQPMPWDISGPSSSNPNSSHLPSNENGVAHGGGG